MTEKLDCNLARNFKKTTSDPIELLTLIGSHLKYHDIDSIYKIIKRNIRKKEKEQEIIICQKYGLTESEDDSTLVKHPEFEKIKNDVKTAVLCDMHSSSKFSNDFHNIDKLIEYKYSHSEIENIKNEYNGLNNPLVFIRKLEKTEIIFIKFNHDKKYLKEMMFRLTFDLLCEGEQRNLVVDALNGVLDEIDRGDPANDDLIGFILCTLL